MAGPQRCVAKRASSGKRPHARGSVLAVLATLASASPCASRTLAKSPPVETPTLGPALLAPQSKIGRARRRQLLRLRRPLRQRRRLPATRRWERKGGKAGLRKPLAMTARPANGWRLRLWQVSATGSDELATETSSVPRHRRCRHAQQRLLPRPRRQPLQPQRLHRCAAGGPPGAGRLASKISPPRQRCLHAETGTPRGGLAMVTAGFRGARRLAANTVAESEAGTLPMSRQRPRPRRWRRRW